MNQPESVMPFVSIRVDHILRESILPVLFPVVNRQIGAGIDESNEQIKGLTQAASGSGNSVVLRIKGMKKLQKTGYTTKTLRFDDLEIQANNVEDIKEIFRSLDE